ncbi:MAG: fluoride efflux transporter CrcB [Bryobacterales bacterium]|nr:fluoride efflux transporter CrcB [Bryobacterales bacterium]
MTLAAMAFAGALGAMARYGVSVAALRWLPDNFPYGTLIANLLGCFLLGAVTELTLDEGLLDPQWRLVAGTGFLGAFTTFSTFSVESYRALEAGEYGVALLNVAVNVVAGIALAAAGFWAARAIS